MNIGAFAVCQLVRDESGTEDIEGFNGLGARHPALAFGMIVFLLSLNLLIALIVTADWTVFQTTSIFKYIGEPDLINQSFFTMIIVYPILLLYFSRKYKWGSWKDKLTGKVN